MRQKSSRIILQAAISFGKATESFCKLALSFGKAAVCFGRVTWGEDVATSRAASAHAGRTGYVRLDSKKL